MLYPVTGRKGWFINFAYYYTFSGKIGSRISAGADFNLISSEYRQSFTLLDGAEKATIDSLYLDAMAGPSVLFWLVKPDVRRFSTYIGNTFALSLKNMRYGNQVFIGTRYFLDLSKALVIEARYLTHEVELAEFTPNTFGSVGRSYKKEEEDKLLLNIGIQICF